MSVRAGAFLAMPYPPKTPVHVFVVRSFCQKTRAPARAVLRPWPAAKKALFVPRTAKRTVASAIAGTLSAGRRRPAAHRLAVGDFIMLLCVIDLPSKMLMYWGY